MKIALVGVGGMGGVHLNVYKNMKDIELCALCDIRLDMLKEKAEGLSARLYSDMEEMLKEEKPDMVDICTPTYLHVEQSVMAMEAGANVLCEKPMALSGVDCEKLTETIKRTGKRYMTAQVVRFMNPYIYLKNTLKSQKYGRLVSLSMQRVSQTPLWSWENWMLCKEKSGHAPIDLMIHDIDYMQSLFGEPEAIVGILREMKDDISNYAVANYIYDGFSVSIESGWYEDQSVAFTASFRAVFEKGNLVLTKEGKLLDCDKEAALEAPEDNNDTGINISNTDGYAGEIKYFIDCIKSGEQNSLATPESAAATISLVERTLSALTKV